MVHLKVFTSYGLPGNCACWRGRKAKKFASRIGKRRCDVLTRFVVRSTHQLPVNVSLMILKTVKPYAAYPIMIDERLNVGFVIGQFFIRMDYTDLNEGLQKEVGETNFAKEEIIDIVCC